MTKDEIIDKLANKIVEKKAKEANFGDLVSGINKLSAEEKGSLLNAINIGDRHKIAVIMINMFESHNKSKAVSEVTTMLANNTLSLAELEIFLQ